MSRFRSDPLRPDDHVDEAPEPTVNGPRLDAPGWARWVWRQITSMRTAIVLLLMLALGAIPGSLVPQRTADPNGVIQYYKDNPEWARIFDQLQFFDLYGSFWFSAIYTLLFVSLIGCVIPRARHHFQALRSQPPRTPARFTRLEHHHAAVIDGGGDPETTARDAVDLAQRLARSRRYRVARYDRPGSWSVSAERGYGRESGNLVFHIALVGVLVSVLGASGFTYTGQRVVVEGTTFVNAMSDYSSFTPGRFVDGSRLQPYAMTLDTFDVRYELPGTPGAGQAGDFSANVTIRGPGMPAERVESIRVNHPITVGDERIYLLGNGYAPTITVRNATGDVVYSDALPFLPQDSFMTSLGIIKVPDGLPEQIGLVGFLYPTRGELASGALTSIYPDLVDPVVTFNVYVGDLGINDGTPRSVYVLDTSGMDQRTGADTGVESLELSPGDTVDLPDGWGTVTFEDASEGTDPMSSVKRFASLQIQHDAGATWVLLFAIIATFGLIVALLFPRRRIWVRARVEGDRVALEYAALARGDDPNLGDALDRFRADHLASLPIRHSSSEGTP